MSTLLGDLRLAFRLLVRRPAFTVLALLTLTVGVTANTAVFSLVNGVFFKPLPLVQDPGRLVEISQMAGRSAMDVPYPILAAMRAESRLLSDAVGVVPAPVSVGIDDHPAVRLSLNVTGNYFSVLGIQPAVGRFFGEEESFPPATVSVTVISDQLWREQFAADPAVVGRTVRVNGMALQVIGVAPPGFKGHVAAADAALFIPLGVPVPGLQTAAGLSDPNSGMLQVLGRLAPDAGRDELAAALTIVTQQVLRDAGTPQAELYRARVVAFSPVPLAIRGGVAIFLGALLVVSGVLLLMTCISVAGMLLARATERHGELVVRRALGATRARIAGQLLAESLVFFLLAGVMGAMAAAWLTPLLGALRPPLPPGFSLDLDLTLDWRVVVWTAVVAGVTGVLVSLPPALGASRPDLARGLREEGVTSVPARRRLRSVLVGVQMAATAFLLVVGGLFIRSLGTLDRLDPGWNPDEVVVARVDLELAGIDRDGGPLLYEQLRRRIAGLPGVTEAAFVAKLPFSGQSSLGLVSAEASALAAESGGAPAYFNRVTPGYFRTMGITLVRGRDIAETDRAEGPPVAVVSAAMAERLWPGQSPIGQRFRAGPVEAERSFEVIGVAENTVVQRLNEEPVNFYYIPHVQIYNSAMLLVVRSRRTPAELTEAAHAAVAEVAPQVPMEPLLSMRDTLSLFFLPQRLAAWVAGLLGLMGMVIGVAGVYGVAVVSALQRRREMGIRLALGSRPGAVLVLLLRQVARAPLIGMVAGLGLAMACAYMLSQLMAGLNPADPVTYAIVIVGLGGICLLATWLPARRMATMDPGRTLRER